MRSGSPMRTLLSTTMGYGLVEVLSRCVQAAAIFILASRYSKVDFGNFYTYFAAYQLITVLSTGGLLESFMSGLAKCAPNSTEARRLGAAFVKRYLARSLSISTIAVILAIGLESFSNVRISIVYFTAAIFGGSLYGLITFLSSYLTCSGLNRQAIILRTAYTISAYSLSVVIAIRWGGIFSFFVGMCIAGIVTLLFVPHGARLLKYFSAAPQSATISAGSDWFLVPTVLNWFFWYGLVVCVQRYFGSAHAAELGFVNTIASVLTMINSSVSQAWLSTYILRIGAFRSVTEAKNALVFKLQSVFMMVIAVIVIVGYETLRTIKFSLASKYGDLGLELSILLFSMSISSMYFSAINSFAVNNEGRRLAAISIAAYIASVAFLVLACYLFDVFGVYIGLAALVISRGFAITYYAMKRFGAGFFDARLIAANLALFAVVAFCFKA
jgi:O-antigen/teichoic acid export membrane protein